MLDREASAFFERFNDATATLQVALTKVADDTKAAFRGVQMDLDLTRSELEDLRAVAQAAEDGAQEGKDQAQQAGEQAFQIFELVELLAMRSAYMREAMDSVLKHLGLESPAERFAREVRAAGGGATKRRRALKRHS